jgi:hypothetical protein
VTAGIVALGLCAGSAHLAAATALVTTTADSGPGSLREAVALAAPGTVITFAPEVTGAIQLTSGPLIINGEVTIIGPQPTLALAGGPAHRVLEVAPGARALLQDLTVEAGTADSGGGGIMNHGWLLLQGCRVRNNRSHVGSAGSLDPADPSGSGGGILNWGELELRRSEVADNFAQKTGGGILNLGTLTVTQSTIRHNHAELDGGGLNLRGGTAGLTNVTVSGNTTAFGAGSGGWVGAHVQAQFIHCTVYGNSLTGSSRTGPRPQVELDGEGSGLHSEGQLELSHTIVAGSWAAVGRFFDLSGFVISLGYNLIEHRGSLLLMGSMEGTLFDVDPLLEPLGDYGGDTLTHNLTAESPAIDAGTTTSLASVDQRGYPRLICAAVDLGAVEFQRPHLVPPPDVELLEDDTSRIPLPFTVQYLFSTPEDLAVSARSSDPTLIPSGGIELSGKGRERFVTLAPEPDAHGTLRVTLRVVAPDGRACERSFQVVVQPCNDPPTLDPIPDLVLTPGSGPVTIPLTGITPGPLNESGQQISVHAFSDNPALTADLTVDYQAPNPTGSLHLQLQPRVWGQAHVTVLLDDDGPSDGCHQSWTTRSFDVLVRSPNCDFEILDHPRDQTVCELSDVTLGVGVVHPEGCEVSYQWHHGSFPIPFATEPVLRLGSVSKPEDEGSYWVLVSNGSINQRSDCANLTITSNPERTLRILLHPSGQTVPAGAAAAFEVSAASCSSVSYQWYLNRRSDGTGFPLLDRDPASLTTELPARGPLQGATRNLLTLDAVTPSDSGDYFVVVRDATDSVTSQVARLLVAPLPGVPCHAPPDQPAQVAGITGAVRLESHGSSATSQPGGSAWVRWPSTRAAEMTFTTAGSPFDSRLRLYEAVPGNEGNRLLLSEDDHGGGYGTSLIEWRVEPGRDYLLEVSAPEGTTCNAVLQWSERTLSITTQPTDQWLELDSTQPDTFQVEVRTSGPIPEFSWWKYGRAGTSRPLSLLGVHNASDPGDPTRYRSTLALSNVQIADVGYYYVVARIGEHQIRSDLASLQVYSQGATDSTLGWTFPPVDNDGLATASLSPTARALRPAISFQAGRVGFWMLDSLRPADRGVSIPPYCARPSQHSAHARWVQYRAQGSGWAFLDTIGSDLPARLAVYRAPGAPGVPFDPAANLVAVACDAGSAPDGQGALVYFEVVQDELYWVVVDGPPQRDGRTETSPADPPLASRIRLNWNVPLQGDPGTFRWIRLRARHGRVYGNLAIDLTGSGINRLLTVFRATHYGHLAPVYIDYPNAHSACFTFVPTRDYLIAVDALQHDLRLFWKLDEQVVNTPDGLALEWTGRRLGLDGPVTASQDPLAPPEDPDGCGPWTEPQDADAATPFLWAPIVNGSPGTLLTGPRTYHSDRVSLSQLPDGNTFLRLRSDLTNWPDQLDVYTNPADLGRGRPPVRTPASTAR